MYCRAQEKNEKKARKKNGWKRRLHEVARNGSKNGIRWKERNDQNGEIK